MRCLYEAIEAGTLDLVETALASLSGFKPDWRVKRNRNENPEKWWNFNILSEAIKQRSPAQQRSAEILARYQSGQSGKKIAAALGLSHGAVYRVIDAASATKTRTPGRVQQMRTEIVALYEAGVGPKAIAEQLQVGKTAVNRILRAAAISRRTRRGRGSKAVPGS